MKTSLKQPSLQKHLSGFATKIRAATCPFGFIALLAAMLTGCYRADKNSPNPSTNQEQAVVSAITAATQQAIDRQPKLDREKMLKLLPSEFVGIKRQKAEINQFVILGTTDDTGVSASYAGENGLKATIVFNDGGPNADFERIMPPCLNPALLNIWMASK
jgi:hypothetical protein